MRRHSLADCDAGSATVVLLAVVLISAALAGAVAVVAAAYGHSAAQQVAAEQTALSGARQAVLLNEPDHACVIAQQAALSNDAFLVSCEVGLGGTVTVSVRRSLRPPVTWWVNTAEPSIARAGPSWARDLD